MRPQEILSQRKRAEKALGAAMLAAIELTVREYMDPGQGEDTPPLSFAENRVTEERGMEMNESFDLARFYRLRGVGEETRAEQEAWHGEDGEMHGGTTERNHAEAVRDAQEYAAPSFGAEEISERFERDARRYDASFRVYE